MDEYPYQYYFKVYRKNGEGFLTRAFSEYQAIAKIKHYYRIKDKYMSITMLRSK